MAPAEVFAADPESGFCRDPEAFEALKKRAYAAILKDRSPGDPIRIWVPRCLTGEEAYSHAMALLEYMERLRTVFPVQIFGTDLDEKAIEKARAGTYDEAIRTRNSPRYLRRFFTATKAGYQVNKVVRDMCGFSVQNLVSDPPFARIDLVSCWNMTRMSPSLQWAVIPLFHYALKPEGLLIVGKSVGLMGAASGLFAEADKKHGIYRRKELLLPELLRFNAGSIMGVTGGVAPQEPLRSDSPRALKIEADRLLAKYAPPAVVVSENLEILQARGRTGAYLELPAGRAHLNLLEMSRPGLRFALQEAICEAQQRCVAVRKDVHIDGGDCSNVVDVEVVPFQPDNGNRKLLIVFKGPQTWLPAKEDKRSERGLQELRLLRRELVATRVSLQTAIEQQRTSREELQAAKEEMQARDQELQSVSEELTIANEALQAYKAELGMANLQVVQAKNEMANIPIVLLGRDLRVRRYTPPAEIALGITSDDIGRPFTLLEGMARLPALEPLLRRAIRDEKIVRQEIQDSKGN